jgi:hypothetical protein
MGFLKYDPAVVLPTVGVGLIIVVALVVVFLPGSTPPPVEPAAASVTPAAPAPAAAPAPKVAYPWLAKYDAATSIAARIPPPAGYARTAVEGGTFEEWLRHLPLKAPGAAVHLFDGRPSGNQEAHAAVLDIDVGSKDLMQCADTVIRLRAEYLFSVGRKDDIHFNFTSGDRADFSKWAEGSRPVVKGSSVTWAKTAAADAGHASLRAYLDVVFMYAGTLSLAKELKVVEKVEDLRIGDVFIQPGSPGHVVIVVDLAAAKDGRKAFILAQGFMPAQEPHILKNPASSDPWYPVDFGDTLKTPSWVFKKTDLKRF